MIKTNSPPIISPSPVNPVDLTLINSTEGKDRSHNDSDTTVSTTQKAQIQPTAIHANLANDLTIIETNTQNTVACSLFCKFLALLPRLHTIAHAMYDARGI